MEDSQKSHLRQVGPDEEVREDEGREKYYGDKSSSEKWPEGLVRNEVDEALCRGLELCPVALKDGAVHLERIQPAGVPESLCGIISCHNGTPSSHFQGRMSLIRN